MCWETEEEREVGVTSLSLSVAEWCEENGWDDEVEEDDLGEIAERCFSEGCIAVEIESNDNGDILYGVAYSKGDGDRVDRYSVRNGVVRKKELT
jgi:hypothetical protein